MPQPFTAPPGDSARAATRGERPPTQERCDQIYAVLAAQGIVKDLSYLIEAKATPRTYNSMNQTALDAAMSFNADLKLRGALQAWRDTLAMLESQLEPAEAARMAPDLGAPVREMVSV